MKQTRLLLTIILPLAFLVFLRAALTMQASPNATFTVNSTVDAVDVNPGNGVCETAVAGQCTLRAAVMEANALPGNDSIQLGNNIYILAVAGLDEEAAATGDLDITSAIQITGNSSSQSIIDGNQIDRVFDVHSSGNLSLKSVMVRNGRAVPGIVSTGGGGIQNAGHLTIENSSINNNSAETLDGGGIYNSVGTVTITNSSIISNAITGNVVRTGGGISNNAGSLQISDSQINNNDNNLGYGGGVSSGRVTTVTNSTFMNNLSDNGGGLYLSGSAYITNSLITHNNSLSGSDGQGNGGGIVFDGNGTFDLSHSSVISNTANQAGGIYIVGQGNSTITLTQSSVSENLAYTRGGAIQSALASVNIISSTIHANSTFSFLGNDFGGGIHYSGLSNNALKISASTISGNSAGNAAGIFIEGGNNHQIHNSTIAGNKTRSSSFSSTGGAIRFQFTDLTITSSTIASNTSNLSNDGAVIADSDAVLTVENTIIANNVGGNCRTIGLSPETIGSISSSGHNLSSDNSCGFSQPSDMNNTNPQLGNLQNNGGTTFTMALLWISPAIDAGNNSSCPVIDQRGETRPLDGNNDSTAVCDIGSVEYGSQPIQYVYLPLTVKP